MHLKVLFKAPEKKRCFGISPKMVMVMKLTCFLMLIACLQVSAAAFGQKVTITAKQITLKQVFKQIREQTGYNFIYSNKTIREASPVTLDVKDASVQEALNQAFAGQPLSYSIMDKIIIVSPRPMATDRIQLPDKQITGHVTDASTGKPLIGVTIQVKGTTTGTTTDNKGNFSLEVPDNATLIISYLGYEGKEISVNGKATFDIALSSTATGLNQLVVVGYGTQKKIDLTGAVTSIKMKNVLRDRPVSNTALALEGTVPGLLITSNSGLPGTLPTLQICGFESINGGSPLVLVDNVPMSINDVNPQDIESISVLKDAAASSIYGGRAAFGVILITLKKGKKNQPIQFNYSANLTMDVPSDLPVKANLEQTLKALEDFGNTQAWTGQNLATWQGLLADYKANPAKYPGGQATVNGLVYRLKDNDLYNEFMNNSFEQLHNFSFSGGSEKSSYRVSMAYDNENGVMITNKDSYKKYNFNASLTTELSRSITTTINVLYENQQQLKPVFYSSLFETGIGYAAFANTGYDTLSDGQILPFDTPNNILKIEPASKTDGDDLRLFGKVEATPFKLLKITGEYTIDRSTSNMSSFRASNEYMNAQTYNNYLLNKTTSYTISNSHIYYAALNLYASYNKDIGNHHITVLVGTNQESSNSAAFDAERLDVLSASVPSLSTSDGTETNNDSYGEYAISGYFGRLNYNFKDKYLFEANGRYDGSSRFPPGHRFGFFPSFAAGWIISKETFMKSFHNVIQNLKLRISWGEIGNQVVGNDYPYIPGMTTRDASWIDLTTGLTPITINPPPLVSSSFSWETVRTSNIGLDFSLFKGRLNSSLDVYKRQTLNMLTPGAQLPAILGTSAPLENAANLAVKGWGINMTWRENRGKFNYSFGFNLSDNSAMITKFNNPAGLLSEYYVGEKLGEIWGYQTYGFYTENDFVKGTLDAKLENGTLKAGVPYLQGESPNPGDIRYVDLNGDGVINTGNNTLSDPGDQKIIGNTTPRYLFGILGNASWQNFDFSFLIQGVGKSDIWISDQLYWPYETEFESFYKFQLNYWTPDHTNAFYPRSYANASGNTGDSRLVQTKYLSNGAYARLQNVEFGYTVPIQLISKFGLTKLRFFFSGEDIATLDHTPRGIDPEIANVNRGGGYPFIEKYSFGLNVSF